MPGNGAVTRSTLRQQIADALRDEVLAGRLQPGQEFTVKEIAEQYGVSATPVREALVDLSAQGLLDAVQHRGFEVRAYSLDDYRGMIEARSLVTDGIFHRLIEGARDGERGTADRGHADRGHADRETADRGHADRRHTDRGTAADEPLRTAALAAVRRRGEEAARAATAGDLNVLVGYDLRFWRELSTLYGNPYLADFLHRLRVQSWVCAVQHLRRVTDLKGRLWSGHTELVDALARRDPAAAHAVVAAYNAHSLALLEHLAG